MFSFIPKYFSSIKTDQIPAVKDQIGKDYLLLHILKVIPVMILGLICGTYMKFLQRYVIALAICCFVLFMMMYDTISWVVCIYHVIENSAPMLYLFNICIQAVVIVVLLGIAAFFSGIKFVTFKQTDGARQIPVNRSSDTLAILPNAHIVPQIEYGGSHVSIECDKMLKDLMAKHALTEANVNILKDFINKGKYAAFMDIYNTLMKT
jgi:hypothetical protein